MKGENKYGLNVSARSRRSWLDMRSYPSLKDSVPGWIWSVELDPHICAQGETEAEAIANAVEQLHMKAKAAQGGIVRVELADRNDESVGYQHFEFPPEERSEVEECSGRCGFRDAVTRILRLIRASGWKQP